MEFLNSWLQGIIIAVIVATIIEMILPNNNSKKYVKVVLGVYVVFNIITPVVNEFFSTDFELSSIFNIEEYTKEIESYEVNSKNVNINQSNEENIKQIYISNLKSDMKAKIEEKGYCVKNMEIEIEDNETYQIKSVLLCLEKNEYIEIEESNIIVNEIEKVKIQVGEQQQELEESSITEEEKKQLKEYLVSIYEMEEITIY